MWNFAVTLFGALFIFCVILPFLGGLVLYKAMQMGTKPNPSIDLCFKVFFGSVFAAMLMMLPLGAVLPSPVQGRLVHFAVFILMQVVLVLVLMRNTTPRAILIEIAVVVGVNAPLVALSMMLMPSSPSN
jgi:hypothetical protein